ncbi:MAG TPA: undecaprenyl-diphosphate phosphatase [Planctomycetes bacterium]|nr:undecaprenyl-diphosphate phosphatase [Planctomycetota bacterium]
MVDWVQAVVLALVQGLTEFLPISSSAHLILFPHFLGWPDQGPDFDVAVHVGTLLAVILFFRSELLRLSGAGLRYLKGARDEAEGRLAIGLILGTLPICVVGVFAKDWVGEHLRQDWVIAAATIFFGILLWISDLRPGERKLSELRLWDAFWIGVAQVFAMIPGTSRSGATMTGALFLGFDRVASARFSFLLSIPTIFLAGMALGWDIWKSRTPLPLGMMALGVLVSALSAYACIAAFMALVERMGMLPFVLYRFLLGGILFWVLL